MIKKTILALAALTAGVSAQAQTESSALSVTVDVTYVSDYVFRGAKLDDASIQPSVEAAYGDFYAGLWYSSSYRDNASPAETDLYAGYGFQVTDVIKLDGGLTRYIYSNTNQSSDSTEIFVGATADVTLSPSLYYYYDFDLEVSSVEASIGYSLPVDAINASLDLTGKVGYVYNHDAAPAAVEDYTYFSAGVAVPFKLNDSATLTVGADYIHNTEKASAGYNHNDNDIVVAKAGVSIGF